MDDTRTDLKATIQARLSEALPRAVWTPADFLDVGGRDAVDKALQRMVGAGELRRIDRGLYLPVDVKDIATGADLAARTRSQRQTL